MTHPFKRTNKERPSLMKDERGLSTVEYVILLVLIAAACVGIWMTFGKTIHTKISEANEEVNTITIDHAGEGSDGSAPDDH